MQRSTTELTNESGGEKEGGARKEHIDSCFSSGQELLLSVHLMREIFFRFFCFVFF